VHQDINVKLFLELDNLVDFLLDGIDVLLFRDPNESNHTQDCWWTRKQ